MTTLNPDVLRADFPILAREVNGKPLAYLDNAASTQHPRVVIEAVAEFYRAHYANVRRGLYTLSEEATAAYEQARDKVAAFIHAPDRRGVIFTRNTTESINLVAYTWGRRNLSAGDKILVTALEHHANIVPWQQLAAETGAWVAVIPVDEQSCCDMNAFGSLLDERVKLVAITQMSNVLGSILPVREFVDRAHAVGAVVLLDGAQGVPHLATDVQALDVDFLAASGHKMLGPTGIGFLYGKRQLLEAMPPFMTGGEMIRRVTWEGSEWNELPYKFEAGTPAIAEAIGLGVAVDYLTRLGMHHVRRHEVEITRYALERLSRVQGMRIYGPLDVEARGGAIAFNLGEVHAHDLASILDREGIAIRAGHHCAMPLHLKLGVPATARASFYIYNEPAEVDRLAESLDMARRVFEG